MPKRPANSVSNVASAAEQATESEQETHAADSKQDPSNQVDNAIKCNEFELERLSFKANERGKSGTQDVFFPKYVYDDVFDPKKSNGEKFVFVTGPIFMEKGGIPKFNSKYHKTPNCGKRAHFFVPKLETDEGSVQLFAMLDKIDAHLNEEINVKGNSSAFLYKKKGDKIIPLKGLKYDKLVRWSPQSTEDDDAEENSDKKKYEPYERVKVKLMTPYLEQEEAEKPENIDVEIQTTVFLPESIEAENTRTISDVEQFFNWKCTAQFAIYMTKLWVNAKKECGVGLVCKQIGITKLSEYKRQSANSNNTKSIFANMMRGNASVTKSTEKPVQHEKQPEKRSEKRPEKQPEKPAEKPTNKQTKQTKLTVKEVKKEEPEEEEEEEEEEEVEEEVEESESEPEPEPAPKSKPKSGKR